MKWSWPSPTPLQLSGSLCGGILGGCVIFSRSPLLFFPSFLLSAVQQRLRPGVRLQQSELPERVLPAQRCLQAAVWSAYYVRRGLSCWYVHLHYGGHTRTRSDARTRTLAGAPIPPRYIHLHRENPEEGYTHWAFPAHFSAGTRMIQSQCKASLAEV